MSDISLNELKGVSETPVKEEVKVAAVPESSPVTEALKEEVKVEESVPVKEEVKVVEEPEKIQVSILDENDFKDLDDDEEDETASVEEEVKAVKEEEVDVEEDSEDLDAEKQKEAEKNFEEVIDEVKETIKIDKSLNLKALFNGANIGQAINMNNIPKPSLGKPMSWVLGADNRGIQMKPYLGSELSNIVRSKDEIENNQIRVMKEILTSFYNHITSPKPDKLNEWIKTVNHNSMEDLFFTAFLNAYHGGMHFLRTCDACGYNYLDKNVDESKLYEIDDEYKERFEKIITNEEFDCVPIKLHPEQISDDYVAVMKTPSIFTNLIEPSYAKRDFVLKYADLIDDIAYIEAIYYIQRDENGKPTFRPINLKEYPNDKDKTFREKVSKYGRILRGLSTDEYADFTSKKALLNSADKKVNYKYPESVCPKCGKKHKAEYISAQELLFLRHQLPYYKTLSK